MLKVILLLPLLILVHITTVSGAGPMACPNTNTVMCPAGARCEGECVTGATAATGAGPNRVCAVPVVNTPCLDGVCVDEACVTVSAEPMACFANNGNAACSGGTPYCVNGWCVAHKDNSATAKCMGK